MVRAPLVMSIVMLLACGTEAAQGPRTDLVKARLVADVAAVKPRGTFTAGVLLEVAPDWHVYWTNPGDSGAPIRVKLTAPEGFTVGEVRFPVPRRFEQPADVVGFGYGGSVLLTAEVKAPADLKPTATVQLAASVSWLCCHDVCLPGKADLDLTLPVSDAPAPSAELKLFEEWAPCFPVDVAGSKDVAKIEWTADAPAGTATMIVTWTAPGRDFDLFPGRDAAVEVGKPACETRDNRTKLTVPLRVLAGKTPGATLPAVFAYTDDKGVRRGVRTQIPVSRS